MKLTGDEVDALFRGEAVERVDSAPASSSGKPREIGYARCEYCRIPQPCLATFNGQRDWEASIPLDDPVRDAVNALRKAFGKRTILLCDWCVNDLGKGNYDTDKVKAAAVN